MKPVYLSPLFLLRMVVYLLSINPPAMKQRPMTDLSGQMAADKVEVGQIGRQWWVGIEI